MAQSFLWQSIAQTLTAEIAGRRYAPGDKLPSEADLAHRFGVNRHTVRRALAHLAGAGLTHAQRGKGVFVTARPADHGIGRRARLNQSLRAAGHSPDRTILRLETRRGAAYETEALELEPGAMVHLFESLSRADATPVALSRSVFPAERFAHLPEALRRTYSITEALASCGVSDHIRAWTRLNAKLATPTKALHLQISPGAPILRTISLNVDAGGSPVEYGQTWFAGERITVSVGAD